MTFFNNKSDINAKDNSERNTGFVTKLLVTKASRKIAIITAVFMFAVFLPGCGSPVDGSAIKTTAAANTAAETGAAAVTKTPAETSTAAIAKTPEAEATPETASASQPDSLGVIGVALPTLDTEYYIRLLNEIKKCAALKNFEITAIASDKAGGEQKALEALKSQGVQSVIIDPDNIGGEGVSNLKNWCVSAGLLCVTILDDGESYESEFKKGGSPFVSIPISTGGIGFAIMDNPDISNKNPDILNGRLFIIASEPESAATREDIQGLYFDDKGAIMNRKKIKILQTAYVDEVQPLASVVNGAFEKYKNIDTFICIDRKLSYDLLVALNSAGYKGNLICYTYETLAEKMQGYSCGIKTVYAYSPIEDIAANSFDAAMTLALFKTGYDGEGCLAFKFP